ncbi:MAG: type I-U CRISPR-associated protein Csx17, partial [Deltaproteobacteria bacterium]|nr:type I-U CRISPR-associated protein Csx17 [Deltaproteobacteria bacterium]
MTFHLHHLHGCTPTPLAYYLKAIGILRLVAQQKDADARGLWRDQHFCLLTRLDTAALERFFLEEYAPTPFVSPWNKGSGFYIANDEGLGPVERSTAPRFEPFRQGIAAARPQLGAITRADAEVRRLKGQTKKTKKGTKPERSKEDPEFKAELLVANNEFKRLKADLFVPFALVWRGLQREWMDAAMVLSPDGQPSWPALLGTGGNDGRLDFTNTVMKRLGDLFDLGSARGVPRPGALALLQSSLVSAPAAALVDAAVGQFLPGSAGGANGTTGPEASSRVNPWDFVLMLEGAVAFRGQATRRLGVQGDLRAAVPFAVTAGPVGHGTRGREKATRGEQWMPLWERPASWQDVTALFCEGRAQLGRSSARRPLDFARAIAKLGVARGLSGFVRYG